ncbi:M48 family metallopeptidase [Bartonella ancashensis]|uniref:Zinc metallopeptidase n=1 Tax=Bartonella ancashensis TaxID=1318743 RepID=A0A0M4M2Z2_9HYPH|nr:SprT family zinc-dependent metalloprotease [Bartonella ancashensis]ALE03312.1 Zinc metallopeptidase [Bartonella ancashensis]
MAVYEQSFIFADYVVPLRVKEHRHARRLTLRVDANGEKIGLTVPPTINRCVVQRFIETHRPWIEERLTHIFESCENFHLKEGTRIPLLGVSHVIKHREGRGIAEIVLGDIGQEPQIVVYGQLAHLPRRVMDILKKQAEIVITPLVAHYAHKIKRKVKLVRYRDTKSRWGSCAVGGHLSFSWRLVMAPKEVIEYVVAHEVAHLIEMNHGIKFWDLCKRLCPEYKIHQDWLRKNGHLLQKINFR